MLPPAVQVGRIEREGRGESRASLEDFDTAERRAAEVESGAVDQQRVIAAAADDAAAAGQVNRSTVNVVAAAAGFKISMLVSEVLLRLKSGANNLQRIVTGAAVDAAGIGKIRQIDDERRGCRKTSLQPSMPTTRRAAEIELRILRRSSASLPLLPMIEPPEARSAWLTVKVVPFASVLRISTLLRDVLLRSALVPLMISVSLPLLPITAPPESRSS